MILLLYSITALIWGSSWFAVHYQIGSVPPVWSIIYRFTFAAGIIWAYCLLSKKNMRFSRGQHYWFMLQGIFLCSANYILFYFGSRYINSGLVSLLFACIVLFNIFNARLFYGKQVNTQVLFGAVLGLVGLLVVFYSEISYSSLALSLHHHLLLGSFLCLSATYMASLGSLVSARNLTAKLPILQSNAYAMLYGVASTFIVALITRQSPSFDWHPSYLVSLAYLVVFGTVIAFATYLRLINQIGTDRAGYTFVLIPIIATVLSTWFEHFHWTISMLIGIMLVVFGNFFVLMYKTDEKKTPTQASAY